MQKQRRAALIGEGALPCPFITPLRKHKGKEVYKLGLPVLLAHDVDTCPHTKKIDGKEKLETRVRKRCY
jgi:hypothetical protein